MLDHGSKMAARSHSEKKLICQYVLNQLANFDDQNVQGGFQGAESIGKGFNMT